VQIFARKDSSGKPEALQGPHGSFSRRKAQINMLTKMAVKMTEEVLGAARRDRSELE
jgi:hypothetical protein